jgi:hypothetical protein
MLEATQLREVTEVDDVRRPDRARLDLEEEIGASGEKLSA